MAFSRLIKWLLTGDYKKGNKNNVIQVTGVDWHLRKGSIPSKNAITTKQILIFINKRVIVTLENAQEESFPVVIRS